LAILDSNDSGIEDNRPKGGPFRALGWAALIPPGRFTFLLTTVQKYSISEIMESLTTRQTEILAALKAYQNKHGYPPSLRELAEHFQVYPNTIRDHLKALARKGFLTREPNRSRGLSVIGSPSSLRTIPLYGTISAGNPLLIGEEAEDYVTLPEEWARGEDVFLLRVRGESMSPYILPGDQVIVRRQERLPIGAVGVFRLENEITLKRYYQEKGQVILRGDNPEMEPLVIKKGDHSAFSILGKVVGVYRPLNG
jgi:repressor LexA